MNFSHIFTALAGIGAYIVLQAGMDYVDRHGDQQVAQACVKQQVKGKWSEAACARARK